MSNAQLSQYPLQNQLHNKSTISANANLSSGATTDDDSITLDFDYLAFEREAKVFLGDRIFSDYARRFAYGIDASCYRYIPKLVVWVKNEEEIAQLYDLSQKYNIPLTFRASGTSLSGQACSDSVLVVANEFWKNIKIKFENNADSSKAPTSIVCDCGVIGSDANAALKPYNRKIGPDPATINNALIGGIFSNNSSGMCCGVKQNSYQTIKSIRVILGDLRKTSKSSKNYGDDRGEKIKHNGNAIVLDTSDEARQGESLASFISAYPHIVKSLLDLREEILADKELCEMIKRKFAIKNTTGYALNALVDFSDIKDILNHIFIGAEGTLGFISRVEYECVQDYAHKACALLFYENLSLASEAVKILARNDSIVSAAEIMDYACLMSASSLDGMPSEISKVKSGNCAILVQLEEDCLEALEKNITTITSALSPIESLFGVKFSFDSAEQESWWKIRKALLPLSASSRPSGSTVITEDICFEIDSFAKGIQNTQELFAKHGYEGIIFGHALSGNVHFIITPLLKDKAEITRFGRFMEDLAKMVASLGGSTKAEHGTGRMVAPFVELEWGEKAYKINQKIKQIFDFRNLINPDVIITNDKNIHLKNLKPAAQGVLEDYLDACMECGFCEKICPSKHLTLTPRQRIALRREIKRLKSLKNKTNSQRRQYEELKKSYKYLGVQTCATCSMCATLCPLEIDTAKIALKLSPKWSKKYGGVSALLASSLSHNISLMTNLARHLTSLSNSLQELLTPQKIQNLTRKFYATIGTPILPMTMPKPNEKKIRGQQWASKFLEDKCDNVEYASLASNGISSEKLNGRLNGEVVYFTSCLNRIFAPKSNASSELESNITKIFDRPMQEVFESLCKKANFYLHYPQNIQHLCCGKAYKNHKEQSQNLAKNAYLALREASQNGRVPIVCDHSACSLELLKKIKEFEAQESANSDYLTPLRFYDLPAFVSECLLPHLDIVPLSQATKQNPPKVALYAPCGTRNLSVKSQKWEESIFSIAKACGAEIIQDSQVKCCGFAGNKGFITPELNESALKYFGTNFLKSSNQSPLSHSDYIFDEAKMGFSSSSTCEIGLAQKSGFEWRHIIYLADICAK